MNAHATPQSPSLRDIFVSYEATRAVESALQHTFDTCIGLGHALIGPTCSGKTTLIRQWSARHPWMPKPGGIIAPVVTVPVPVNCTPEKLVTATLAALKASSPFKESADRLHRRMIHFLIEREVRTIVFDEAQHLVDRDKNATRRNADWLASLMFELICAVVIVGLPPIEELLAANNELKLGCHLQHLAPFDCRDPAGFTEFTMVLDAFDRAFALTERSGLCDTEIARRIACATGGSIGHVARLLRAAFTLARERGMSRVDLPLLAEAHARVSDRQRLWSEGNPFDPQARPL